MLAGYCADHTIPLIHISTDFVFDGKQSQPYQPDDACAPLGIYGLSKRQGEQQALALCSSATIIRTGWLYSARGNNFVKTMLRCAAEGKTLNVVDDQVGTPTYALHLAAAIWQLLVKQAHGIFHFSDAGLASWYDFAAAIFEEAHALGLLSELPVVNPVSSDNYPTAAARPSYSVLDKTKIWALEGIEPCHWREGLRKMLKELTL